MNTQETLSEARGWRDLGLLKEAGALLRAIPAEDSLRDKAQADLIGILLAEGSYAEAAELGLAMIARGTFRYDAIIDTVLVLHFLGRLEEARDTLRLVEKCGHSLADDSYQMACIASRLGEYPDALQWLLAELRRSREYGCRACSDSDLRPLWDWLKGHQPSLEEAFGLLSAPLPEFCAAALRSDAALEIGGNDFSSLPPGAAALFRHDFKGGFSVLIPQAAAHDPALVAEVTRRHVCAITDVEECVRGVRERAAAVVLAAQPEYARQQAQSGNRLAARYHLLWAVQSDLSMLEQLDSCAGLEPMRSFLDDLRLAACHDADYFRKIQEIPDIEDAEEGWRMLGTIPQVLHDTGLYLLRLAGLHRRAKEHERAFPLWEELRRRWPLDAAAYGNAINSLISLGRKDEAWQIFLAAPACYRNFRPYWEQLGKFNPPTITLPKVAEPRFFGQPDLGGLLLPRSFLDAQAEAAHATTQEILEKAPPDF